MKSLTQDDLQFVLARMPRDLLDLMRKHPLFLGGGFIRETIAGGEVQDVDLFGPSVDLLESVAGYLTTCRNAREHWTPNAITVLAPPRLPVQFITRWCYADAETLVEQFDFTVCQAAIWWRAGRWHSLTHDNFYSDLAARRLVYTFPKREEAAGGSLLRVRKFLPRGYNIQAHSLAGVIARLAMAVDFSKTKGESDVAHVVAGLLHEVDPIRVIDGVEPIDEHEIVQ